jgi:TonB family protein
MSGLSRRTRIGAAVLALLACCPGAGVAREDPRREAARTAFFEAERIRDEGGATSADAAVAKYEEALAAWSELGERSWQSACLNGMGLAFRAAKRRDRALESFERAVALAHAARDGRGEANVLLNYASLSAEMDRLQEAVDAFERAASLYRVDGDRIGEATACAGMRDIYIRLENGPMAADAQELVRHAVSKQFVPFADVPVMRLVPLLLPKPRYNEEARARKVQGSVVVQVVVGEDGSVIFARPLRGPQLLFGPAVEAAMGARFSPPLRDGAPTRARVTLSVSFTIR